jgi:hypothetical protein
MTFTNEEWTIIQEIHDKATTAGSFEDGKDGFQKAVEGALPSLSPALIMKLHRAGVTLSNGDNQVKDAGDETPEEKQSKDIAKALNQLLKHRLELARDVLAELMNAGEIKKLDDLIGKAARSQQLDAAFFQVLQLNLQDAAAVKGKDGDDNEDHADASRLQVLQHIYTRCQEEVEKTIDPGTALLNKLLRTDATVIRRNQLEHYLCPQSKVITAPNGKQVELPTSEKTLVDHEHFVEALANTVLKIRTIEKASGMDPIVAAGMVSAYKKCCLVENAIGNHHYKLVFLLLIF